MGPECSHTAGPDVAPVKGHDDRESTPIHVRSSDAVARVRDVVLGVRRNKIKSGESDFERFVRFEYRAADFADRQYWRVWRRPG